MTRATLEPIRFHPIYAERVWGGRELESTYHRQLPRPDRPYGESWEIVDRENEQSIVDGGPFDGATLNQLWNERREEIFGSDLPAQPRFPLLIKILDARDDLSIQVHPPAALAPSLGGEPKTEMWYIADRKPGAKLYIGLRRGVSRQDFERAIHDGTVEACVHAIQPAADESIFIPSGRLHAIGAGFLIHEIQQNSDTTYRVFDWNRSGLDGKPRELHVEESMACIDFHDFEPTMDAPRDGLLASCEHFETARIELAAGLSWHGAGAGRFAILSLISGGMRAPSGREFGPGDILLLPRGCAPLETTSPTLVLRTTLPGGES